MTIPFSWDKVPSKEPSTGKEASSGSSRGDIMRIFGETPLSSLESHDEITGQWIGVPADSRQKKPTSDEKEKIKWNGKKYQLNYLN
jgi:hypothetical protein